MANLTPREEIAVDSFESASKVAYELVKNGYCVMISTEEKLFIVNYIWSGHESDRNNVVFMDRENFEDAYGIIVGHIDLTDEDSTE